MGFTHILTLCFFSSPCTPFLVNDTLKLHTRLSNAISCVIPKNGLPSTTQERIYGTQLSDLSDAGQISVFAH